MTDISMVSENDDYDEFDICIDRASQILATKMKISYGFWTTLLGYFHTHDQLSMQALNHYSYHVSISRVQTRILLPCYGPLFLTRANSFSGNKLV